MRHASNERVANLLMDSDDEVSEEPSVQADSSHQTRARLEEITLNSSEDDDDFLQRGKAPRRARGDVVYHSPVRHRRQREQQPGDDDAEGAPTTPQRGENGSIEDGK